MYFIILHYNTYKAKSIPHQENKEVDLKVKVSLKKHSERLFIKINRK